MTEECRSYPHRNGSLKLRDICFLTVVSVKLIALTFSGIMFDLCDTYRHLFIEYVVDFLCVLAVVSGRTRGSSTGIVGSKCTILLNKAKFSRTPIWQGACLFVCLFIQLRTAALRFIVRFW
jgi:hypothetical protein